MPISMSRNAKYVVQSGIYDCPMLGTLTNHRIAYYELAGRYGDDVKKLRERERAERIVTKSRKQQNAKFRQAKKELTNFLLDLCQ